MFLYDSLFACVHSEAGDSHLHADGGFRKVRMACLDETDSDEKEGWSLFGGDFEKILQVCQVELKISALYALH